MPAVIQNFFVKSSVGTPQPHWLPHYF